MELVSRFVKCCCGHVLNNHFVLWSDIDQEDLTYLLANVKKNTKRCIHCECQIFMTPEMHKIEFGSTC